MFVSFTFQLSRMLRGTGSTGTSTTAAASRQWRRSAPMPSPRETRTCRASPGASWPPKLPSEPSTRTCVANVHLAPSFVSTCTQSGRQAGAPASSAPLTWMLRGWPGTRSAFATTARLTSTAGTLTNASSARHEKLPTVSRSSAARNWPSSNGTVSATLPSAPAGLLTVSDIHGASGVSRCWSTILAPATHCFCAAVTVAASVHAAASALPVPTPATGRTTLAGVMVRATGCGGTCTVALAAAHSLFPASASATDTAVLGCVPGETTTLKPPFAFVVTDGAPARDTFTGASELHHWLSAVTVPVMRTFAASPSIRSAVASIARFTARGPIVRLGAEAAAQRNAPAAGSVKASARSCHTGPTTSASLASNEPSAAVVIERRGLVAAATAAAPAPTYTPMATLPTQRVSSDESFPAKWITESLSLKPGPSMRSLEVTASVRAAGFAWTVRKTREVLLPATLGSGFVAPTVAVFVTVPATFAVTTIVIVTLLPGAMRPRAQRTSFVQVPCVVATDTTPREVGRTSLTVTSDACTPDLCETVSV